MKKAVTDRWVAALRSGEYSQGQGCLRRKPATPDAAAQYCCLGVLCELAVQAGVAARREAKGMTGEPINTDVYYDPDADDDCDISFLPDVVKRWAGMGTAIGFIPTAQGGSTSLYALNDRGTSFTEIANIIEQHQEAM